MAEITSKKKAARNEAAGSKQKKHKTEGNGAADDVMNGAAKNGSHEAASTVAEVEELFELSMLDCLAALSSFDRPTRMLAASSLVAQLTREQGSESEPCENLTLVLERVTHGLASGREGSRQGFGVVLTELLQAFPEQTPLSHVLAVVDEKMDPTGEKGDAEKQIYFGKIFAVACVMRSGRLATAESGERAAVLGKCFEILVAMFEKRSYMKELVAHTLVELLGLLGPERELRQIALPALQSLLAVAPDECSPESLALMLSLPGTPLQSSEWQQGVPLLCQSEQLKPALLASSYAHPRVHFVWKLVLDGAQVAGSETVRSVWSLVDSALFGSHVDNRKYLAFSLLIEFLRRAQSAEDVLFFLGSPNTTRALVNNLASSHPTKMSDVATRVLDEIKRGVAASPPLGLALLQARFLGPVNLDLQLVPLLPAEFGLRYLDALLAGFSKEQGERIVSAVKRGWKKWAGEDKDKSSPAAAALASRATEMTRAFAKLAFLSESEAERQWAKMRLASVLTELEVTGHAQLLELCQWLLPQLGERTDAKTSKRLSKAFRLPAPNGRYELAFSKILSLLALEMLEGGEEAREGRAELWADVVEASTKFAASIQQGDGKERNRAVLVLVSLMLELLTTPSALHRAVVVNAFRLIAPMVPEYGIRDIVIAVISSENEDAEEQGEDKGEDDDEEEGGNMSDDVHHNHHHDHAHDDDHRGEDADQDIFAGENLPDIMLDDADPEYLKRVEESLGNIFRAMRDKKANSGAKKASAALDYKLRVVDLLENFAHSVSRMASMESLPLNSRAEGDNRSVVFSVLPLLLGKLKKSQHSAALKQLNDKLYRVVLKEICEMREWPAMAGHARVLFKAFRNVAAFATRGNPTKEFAAVVQGSLVVLTRVLSQEKLLPSGLLAAELLKVARFCGTRKNLRFLTVDKFFAPMWKRMPETVVQLFPSLAEALGDKEWTQHARGATVAGMIDFLLRGGKSHLLQEPSQVAGCVQSLERAFLASLRFENGKIKPQALAKTVGEVRTVYVDLLSDPRLGAVEKSQLYNALPLRSEVAEALTAVMAKYPQASKLKTQGSKLIKLFHLEG